MTIKLSAMEDFLARELTHYDWIKRLDSEDLDEELSRWNPPPIFHTPPFLHQKAAFTLGSIHPDFLYLLDLGLGKTKLMLDILTYENETTGPHCAIAVVPNVANIENWVEQVQEHAPHLVDVPLFGSTEERWRTLDDTDGDIYIINYDGLVAMVTDLVKKKPKSKKRHRVINDATFRRLAKRFDWSIYDESTHFKNHTSLTFSVCNRLAGKTPHRYALTGTPFGRDPIDLWAQFRVIDRGATLGQHIGLFRACFFKEKKNYFSKFPEYKFDKRKEKQVHEILKNRSIFYSEDECPDLPAKQYIRRPVTFPVDTYQYYDRVVQEVIGTSNKQLMKNSYVQMRQLASGFLGVKDDDTGEKAQIVFDDNPKLDELEELVLDMPTKAKMVVYHEYLTTGAYIALMLERLGIGYERLYGGTKDQAAALRRFKDEPACRVFVVNNKSGAFGLNLQVANYVVFFETPDSPIIRRQAEKRCHRPGQKAGCVFYYDLVMKNSIDIRILDYLSEGKELFQALVAGKAKWR